MKKLTENLAVKITAIILSFVTAAVFAVSVVAAVMMLDNDFYTKSYERIEKTTAEDVLWSEFYNARYAYQEDGAEALEFFTENRNLYVTITDPESGKVLFDNYGGQEYSATISGDEWIYGFAAARIKYGSDYDGEFDEDDLEGLINITLYAAKEMQKTDMLSFALHTVSFFYAMRYKIYIIGIAAFIITAVLIIYLVCAQSHRSDGSIQLNHFDKIPFDLLIAAAFLIFVFGIFLADAAHNWMFIASIAVDSVLYYFTGLALILTFAARIKNHTLIKNNVIYKMLKLILKIFGKLLGIVKRIFVNIGFIKKTVIVLLAVNFIDFLVCFSMYSYDAGGILLWFIMFNIPVSAVIMLIAIALYKIKVGGERIAAGDLDYKIDTKYMYGDFKAFGESLNNINTGLQKAVNEKMKSERFKTELITNVSHDIKTPLTSIINYVDLIKKEEPESETVRQYIEVLDRQSGRLKKLIEDLVEASKASTGNLAVNFTECEVGVLLSQTVGEFDERLAKAGLTAVLKQPEKTVKISADGRHLWRVFDNLMSNVCKYSQPGTRVYMDVSEKAGKAVITFRNISRYELNISSDELMERFVRGDSSRNTEGSGLGLSIARSLVELQNGNMNLEVDGDLFKVILTFNAI